MALTNVISIQQAKDAGNQHWKAMLGNWGNVMTGADAESIQYTVPVPVAGAQISAESRVGEVYLRFNSPVIVGAPTPTARNYLQEHGIYIRRGRPYFWRTPAPVVVDATPQTRYGDLYLPSTDSSDTAAFGNGLGDVFDIPELNIVFFFEHIPPIMAMPSQPYTTGAAASPTQPPTISLNDTNEHTLFFVEIQYREGLRVACQNSSDDDVVSVRFTGILGQYGAGAMPGTALREFELFSTPFPVYPDSRISVPISNPEATWLGIYVQKQTNAGASDMTMYLYAD